MRLINVAYYKPEFWTQFTQNQGSFRDLPIFLLRNNAFGYSLRRKMRNLIGNLS
jgi:hypothetical protein